MFWIVVGALVVVAALAAWAYDRRRGTARVSRRNAAAEQAIAEGQAAARYNDFGPGGAM